MINGVRWLLGDHNPTGRPYPIVPKLTFETELKNEVFFMNKGKYLEERYFKIVDEVWARGLIAENIKESCEFYRTPFMDHKFYHDWKPGAAEWKLNSEVI